MSSFASSAEESNKDAKGAKANNKTIGGGSSASSVVKIITPSTASPWGTIGRTFVLSAVALFSKALLGVFNSTTISNHETFVRAATREDRGIATTTKDDDEEEEEEEEKNGVDNGGEPPLDVRRPWRVGIHDAVEIFLNGNVP